MHQHEAMSCIDFQYEQHYPKLILSPEGRTPSVCIEILFHMYDSSQNNVQSTLFGGQIYMYYLNCSYFIATLGDFHLNIRTCYIMYSCYNPVWYFCAVLVML